MEERSSSFFFWLCSRVVGAGHFLGSVLCLFAARLHGGGAGWDVGKCPFALFESSIQAARFLGSGRACLLQSCMGEELDVSVLWVELGLEFCQVGTELRELETQR